MPEIIPDGWRQPEVIGGPRREIETLALLAQELPDAYSRDGAGTCSDYHPTLGMRDEHEVS